MGTLTRDTKMNSLLVLLISFVDASVSCVACEVSLIETPDDGIRVQKGDRRCAETETADVSDLVGDFGKDGMCMTSYQRQVFENGTSSIYYERSGQKFKDPSKNYPVLWNGTEYYSDCEGNYCNDKSGIDFINQNSASTQMKSQNENSVGAGTTCYTCSTSSHHGDNNELDKNCLEPTPGTESEHSGCDLCVQNFESGPEPGHLSIRRACAVSHQDSSTITSHFHFCTDSLCNTIVFSSGKMISLSFILSIFLLI